MAENSRIQAKFLEGDQRVFYVPCVECGSEFEMTWSHCKWDKDEKGNHKPQTAYIKCPHCEARLEEYNKKEMLANGRWKVTNPEGLFPSFRINALYSSWYSWEKMVRKFLNAKKKGVTYLKTWTNTNLGQPFEEDGEKISFDTLFERREVYKAEVPMRGLIMTTGADTQDDRIEAFRVVWGKNHECWHVDKQVFWGDTSTSAPWLAFDTWLRKGYKHENGSIMYSACTCLDAMGHRTDEVYDFCSTRAKDRVFPIQGVGGMGQPVVATHTRKHKKGVDLFRVGTWTIKELHHSALKQKPEDGEYDPDQPMENFVHFPKRPDYDQEFFEQLTAAKKRSKFFRGIKTTEWIKTRPRMESHDCFNYSRAALEITGVDLDELDRMGPLTMAPAVLTSGGAVRRRGQSGIKA